MSALDPGHVVSQLLAPRDDIVGKEPVAVEEAEAGDLERGTEGFVRPHDRVVIVRLRPCFVNHGWSEGVRPGRDAGAVEIFGDKAAGGANKGSHVLVGVKRLRN